MNSAAQSIDDIVNKFNLAPHPEGGFYREIYRAELSIDHPAIGEKRAAATSIYFLLGKDDFSAFHRVRPSDEIWHHYAGRPLELHKISSQGDYEQVIISSDVSKAHQPMSVVQADYWQAAKPAQGDFSEDWSLLGCTVAPGFDFADFEMPPAEKLLAQFPQHEGIIRLLTK